MFAFCHDKTDLHDLLQMTCPNMKQATVRVLLQVNLDMSLLLSVSRRRRTLIEPPHQKNNILHMQKQRHRLAPLFSLHR